MRSALALAALFATSGCINYAAATGDRSPRTMGLFAAGEISVTAIIAAVPYIVEKKKSDEPLSYPYVFALLLGAVVVTDASVMNAWLAE
jgi:hypothetical protein